MLLNWRKGLADARSVRASGQTWSTGSYGMEGWIITLHRDAIPATVGDHGAIGHGNKSHQADGPANRDQQTQDKSHRSDAGCRMGTDSTSDHQR